MDKENVVIFNGKELTEAQFEAEKAKLKESKGIKLVEVTKKEYRTRLED